MTKTYRVLLAKQAQNDLAQLYDYIAADSQTNAAALIHAIEEKSLSLETMPERAAKIPENALLGTDYRHLVHGRYRIVFRVQNDAVFVLRVIHVARLLEY